MQLLCADLFKRFPGVAGLIVRLGECDGVDVHGDFLSRLVLRKPNMARDYVKTLAKLFETLKRNLIIRTWTVGAYELGDLIWNPQTYRQVFDNIVSKSLFVSHKYGPSDFFRFLPLNPLIFEGDQQKIIEFQARREYEGFGEFPSFVGYDYEQYREQLSGCINIKGIHVWCQTGGWSRFHKATFMPGSSIWNEINTAVTIDIFHKKKSAEKAVADFAQSRFPGKDPKALVLIMRLSDEVIKQLWYIPEFSQKEFYLKRVRLPPLLWVYWDAIVVNATVRHLVRRCVSKRQEAIEEGVAALEKIKLMSEQAAILGIDRKDFDFMYATFWMLLHVRRYLLENWSPHLSDDLVENARNYERQYPRGFFCSGNNSIPTRQTKAISLLIRLILRTRSRYRPIETTLFAIGFRALNPLVKLWGRKHLPQFASQRAMGIDSVLK